MDKKSLVPRFKDIVEISKVALIVLASKREKKKKEKEREKEVKNVLIISTWEKTVYMHTPFHLLFSEKYLCPLVTLDERMEHMKIKIVL